MAQVAAWMKNNGREVSGSDQGIYPPMSDFLQSQGVEVRTPYDAANLTSADTVVIGNALSRGNPEVEAALEKRIPFVSLPELIHDEIIAGKLPAVVAGTHGKTTTTAALASIFKRAGLCGGYMMGGLPIDWDQGFAVESGSWFAIEGDEYDSAFFDKRPKFLHYRPQLVLLNAIEFDHADIYTSLDDIFIQFRRLIKLIPRNGCLVASADDPALRPLMEEAPCPVVPFGRGTTAKVKSEFIELTPTGTKFRLRLASGREIECETPLWGDHQLSNLTGAAAAAEFAGATSEDIAAGIASFHGIRRRLELKFEDGRRWVYDDFAHHPTAVKAAILALRKRHPNLPIFAAFEPRSNTMVRRRFQAELTEALLLADGIAIGEIHRIEMIPKEDRLDAADIMGRLSAAGKEVCEEYDADSIARWLTEKLPPEAVILTMSNGAFSGLVKRLIERLSGNKDIEDADISGITLSQS